VAGRHNRGGGARLPALDARRTYLRIALELDRDHELASPQLPGFSLAPAQLFPRE